MSNNSIEIRYKFNKGKQMKGIGVKNPLVSIIIPTYNRDHCIGRAIESVINQSITDWELIIIDNNSTDNTHKIVDNFSDKRISIFKIDNKGIVAKSRNYGVQLTSGKYIAFLDSDDWWAPEKLQIALIALEAGSDIVYHDLYKISKIPIMTKNHSIVKTRDLFSPVFFDLLLNGNAIINSSVVVRRNFLKEINGFSENEELLGSEDFDGWMRIARLTEKFERIEGVLGYYWDGGGNITSAKTVLSNNLFLSKKYSKDIKQKNNRNLPGWMLYSLARASLSLGDYKEAHKNSFLAIKAKLPFFIKIKSIAIWLMSAIKFRA